MRRPRLIGDLAAVKHWTDAFDEAVRQSPGPGTDLVSGPTELDDYLQAAERLAWEHPPRRCAARCAAPLKAGLVATDAVLEPNDVCMVTTGQSSLLRAHLAKAAGHVHAEGTAASVPVFVHTAALTGRPLLDAIAHTATGTHPVQAVRTAFTRSVRRSAPTSGTWLVLVVGLDEIADPR